MLITGIVLLGIGSIGVSVATWMEICYHEPLYKVLMKVFPWIGGIGALIVGVTI